MENLRSRNVNLTSQLANRVAIVTGAGGGIGRCIALTFAREGAHTVAVDIDRRSAERTADEVANAGGRAVAQCADVSSNEDVQRVVRETVQEFRRIDIVVNCAGIYQIGTIEDIGEDDWDRFLAVNLKGVFLFCKAVIPIMRSLGGGSIVSLSSLSGRTKSTLAAPHYVASKAGVIGLTMCLAAQSAAYGIRVNCIAPGPIDTDMLRVLSREQAEAVRQTIPLGRMGNVEDVANVALFLASDASGFITGQTINVNGGSFMI
jgi:3-oxoacyl-[acyl-carrier protein] reductase